MGARQALLQKLEKFERRDAKHFPVLTLGEYFFGKEQEDAVAPKRRGYSSFRVIHSRLKALEARPKAQGVFVGLHQDWGEALRSCFKNRSM